jgi:hypothetical protein
MPVTIHGKEYFTVAERLQMLVAEVGKFNYSVRSEVLHIDDEYVRMKVILTINSNPEDPKHGLDPFYEGTAEEKRNASTINKTSALEVCETSALGRALAFAGYGGNEIASADEVAQAIHAQEQAVSTPARTKAPEKVSEGGKDTKTPSKGQQGASTAKWDKAKAIDVIMGHIRTIYDKNEAEVAFQMVNDSFEEAGILPMGEEWEVLVDDISTREQAVLVVAELRKRTI